MSARHLDLAAKLAAITRKQGRLTLLLSRAEEVAGEIEFDLAEVLQASNVNRGGRRPRGATRTDALLKTAARKGVSSLQIERNFDGSAAVRIDNDEPFRLSHLVGELLALLAADTGVDGDGLPDWKPIASLQKSLETIEGRKFSRHAVTELIYNLRQKLIAYGENPQLVQSHRQRGFRFAIRRKPTAADSAR